MKKAGDVVLVKSPAGDAIPHIHVRLIERVFVKPSRGNNFDWPGYSGWMAELVFQEEADYLRKNWQIPFESAGDKTFVFDRCIIKKPRNPKPNTLNKKRKRGRTVKKSS